VQTLIVASVASAVTSFTVSRIWGPGTLFSAAATPILVALISELVRRPVRQVGATAKVAVAPLRYRPSTPSDTLAAPTPPPPALDPSDPESSRPPFPPPPAPAPETQWMQAPAPPAIAGRRLRPRWRLVLATGLLACLIVIGLFTALDVLAGQSITGNGDSTTYFSGRAAKTAPKPTTPTIGPTGTTGTTGATTTPTVTVTTPAPAIAPNAGATGATSGSTGATGATGTTGASTPPAAQPTTP
jgi:hypothetical protein